MLKKRFISGVTMAASLLAVLVGDLWFAPYYPLYGIVVFGVALATSWELASLLQSFPIPVRKVFCVVAATSIPAISWLPAVAPEWMVQFFGGPNPNFRPAAGLFVGLSMFAFLIEAWNYSSPGRATAAIAGHLVVFFYVGVLGSFVIQLRWFGDSPSAGAYLLMMLIFTAKFCDIGAFFSGRTFGRTKMSPLLSPGKTVEGAIGGVTTAVLFATIAAVIGQHQEIISWFPWYAGALFGLVIGLSALVGDLMESLIKRDCKHKDASDSIPGFGGVLDVVDSVFFAAPVAYLFLAVCKKWMGA